jgi:hypothetical protein
MFLVKLLLPSKLEGHQVNAIGLDLTCVGVSINGPIGPQWLA